MTAGARRTANTDRSPWTVLAVSVLAVVTSACFGAQAKTIAVLPLDVPEAPPRNVEVIVPEVPPLVFLPEEPVHSTTPMPSPAPAPAAGPARPAEPPRTEAAAGTTAKPDEAARPPSPLRTTPTQQELEVEREVRADLAQATADLARIDYRILGRDERTQYDTAKRFISQADAAVRARNLVFALNLADKAAALAGQLAGR